MMLYIQQKIIVTALTTASIHLCKIHKRYTVWPNKSISQLLSSKKELLVQANIGEKYQQIYNKLEVPMNQYAIGAFCSFSIKYKIYTANLLQHKLIKIFFFKTEMFQRTWYDCMPLKSSTRDAKLIEIQYIITNLDTTPKQRN